jgi:DNA recombination-dependent growth factor C
VNKEAADILSGFDRALDRIEALPVNAQEKRRLVKEWLRSRLAETFEVHDRGQ